MRKSWAKTCMRMRRSKPNNDWQTSHQRKTSAQLVSLVPIERKAEVSQVDESLSKCELFASWIVISCDDFYEMALYYVCVKPKIETQLNFENFFWRTSRERREPGPSCQAQATRGEGREGFYYDSAFSISYFTNIQSMQTGTLEALKQDPATILSPCPLHPLQTTWLQWWGILQIHWEEKKSKKKPNHPILFDVSNSMVSLLAHKASINFLHFFL